MWAANKVKIMVSDSVSELIRIAAAICKTPKSPEISSKSLRNHFDNPSPEAIRATIIDLQRIMQVLRDRLKSIDSVMIVMIVMGVMGVMVLAMRARDVVMGVMNVMDVIEVMA
jgi:hypothetical protein